MYVTGAADHLFHILHRKLQAFGDDPVALRGVGFPEIHRVEVGTGELGGIFRALVEKSGAHVQGVAEQRGGDVLFFGGIRRNRSARHRLEHL